MKVLKLGFFLFIMILISYPPKTPGEKIYKWVDKKGVVHFSDRIPESTENIEGEIEERAIKESVSQDDNSRQEDKPSSRSPVEFATSCTFTIKGTSKLGTGFFISPDGYAATCKHVIDDMSNPVALLSDETELAMRIIATSYKYDLALLLVVTPQRMPYLTLRNPETLVPGERLFAIGASAGLQSTVTDGVFTGFRKIKSTNEEVIQFSAPINPGNSGGPLIDREGKVAGVISSKYMMKEGVPVSGVGFAIPSSHLEEEFTEYIE